MASDVQCHWLSGIGYFRIEYIAYTTEFVDTVVATKIISDTAPYKCRPLVQSSENVKSVRLFGAVAMSKLCNTTRVSS